MDSLRCSQEIEERFKAKFFNIKNTPCRHFSKISRGPRLSNRIIAKHTFMHIPKEKRVKTHVIKRDDKVIEAIKTRIEECREYYNNLIQVI